MKIGIIIDISLIPSAAGNRSRIVNLIWLLNQLGHKVDVIKLSTPMARFDKNEHAATLEVDSVIEIQAEQKTLREKAQLRLKRKIKLIARSFGIEWGYLSKIDDRFEISWINELKKMSSKYDVVIVSYVFNSKALLAFDEKTLKIIDTHDCFSNRHRKYSGDEMANSFWLSFSPAEEAKGLSRSDIVFAIENGEQDLFSKALEAIKQKETKVLTVSHLVQTQACVPNYDADNTAVFFGSHNPANVEGLAFFVKNVLPNIINEKPDFRLYVAGTICDRIKSDQYIHALGTFERFQDIFKYSSVFLNPVITGTGISIKQLEAMGSGASCVSTETGVRGISKKLLSGSVYVCSRPDEQFAKLTIQLISSRECRVALGTNAARAMVTWNEMQSENVFEALKFRK